MKTFHKMIIIRKTIVIALVIIFYHSLSYSQDVEIEGFIYDQTKTKIGRDFYEAFLKLWEATETEKLSITIDEISDPRWGTQIFVYVDNTMVYNSVLKPRLEDVDEKADEAVQSVINFIVNRALFQQYLEEEQKFL